jgi:hypothetical protein
LPATTIQKHRYGCCPALLPAQPLKHGVLSLESFRLTAREGRAAVKIHPYKLVVWIPGFG